jgi:predicted HTH domain antitoxin
MSTKLEVIQGIASEISLFQNLEDKETFLFILGALSARLISLKKAAEIMDLDTEVFLKLLEIMGVDFSYVSSEDVEIERNW